MAKHDMDYTMTYSLQDVIRALKSKESYLDKARLQGQLHMVEIVVDSELALKKAGLTPRQQEVIELYWLKDLTLTDVGNKLGISHQAVADTVKQAQEKIQKVLNRWGRNGR